MAGIVGLALSSNYQMTQRAAMRSMRVAMNNAMASQKQAERQQQTAAQILQVTIENTIQQGEMVGRVFSVLSPETSFTNPSLGTYVDIFC